MDDRVSQMTKNLQELFEHEIEDMYDSEHELLGALEDLAQETEDEEISRAFEEHREETQGHIERLEQVFEMLGTEPEREECEAIEGLIAEHDDFLETDPSQEILDVYHLIAGQKAEHYEIAAYGNLAMLADRLGMDEAGDILHETLEEEQEALEKLTTFADEYEYDQVMEGQAAD